MKHAVSETLFIVPTDLERRGLGLHFSARGSADVALCGFGPVAAAARTAGLLAEHRPGRVILVGIAGRIDERLDIGKAYSFTEVACFGVGAGSGDGFMTAGAMGWPQWPGDPADPATAIGDVIPLEPLSGSTAAGLLLTACAASASNDDVSHRLGAFPVAVAEDMEGFGVAFACRLARVPLTIIRGISNTAGDRDTSRWEIAEALASAASLTQTLLETPR